MPPADPAPIVDPITSAPGPGAAEDGVPEDGVPGDVVPAAGWLLAGLAVVHAVATLAVLLGLGGGVGAGSGSPVGLVAVIAGLDAALAVALGGAAAVLRRPPTDRVIALTAAGCAVAAGIDAALLAAPVLAVTAAGCTLAALGLRSVRAAGLVLTWTVAATVVGAGAAVVRGAAVADAVLVTGLALGVVVVVVGLRRALVQQLALSEAASASAEILRVNDALTGVLNRRGLELMVAPMIELARRRGEAVHALFIDVDGFSLVNAELGYERGDDLLVAVAEALNGSIRTTDVVCRAGGDEFVVVGPGTGTSPLEMERRVRELLRATPPVPETVWPSRLSIGSATLVPWDDGDLNGLLQRADSDMRLRRSLRRQGEERRSGDLASPPRGPSPRSEV